jgi:N-methylhydantoinase A
VQVVTCRVTATGQRAEPSIANRTGDGRRKVEASSRPVYFETQGAWMDCPVYWRGALAVGSRMAGPAIIEQADSTTVLYPGDNALVDESGNLVIEVGAEQ